MYEHDEFKIGVKRNNRFQVMTFGQGVTIFIKYSNPVRSMYSNGMKF